MTTASPLYALSAYHLLRNEGCRVMFDDRLSTVWSAPDHCCRYGNLASVLETGPGGERKWNVFLGIHLRCFGVIDSDQGPVTASSLNIAMKWQRNDEK